MTGSARPRPAAKVGWSAPVRGRRAPLRDGRDQRGHRRRRDPVPARRRPDRHARDQRPHPARVLQGRRQDGGHVPGGRRRALRRARRHRLGATQTARSSCTAAGPCRSTRAARRSSPRRSRWRSRATPRCSTPPSSAPRTSDSASQVTAVVELRPGMADAPPDLAELQEHCRGAPRGVQGPACRGVRRRHRPVPLGQARLPLGQGSRPRRPRVAGDHLSLAASTWQERRSGSSGREAWAWRPRPRSSCGASRAG